MIRKQHFTLKYFLFPILFCVRIHTKTYIFVQKCTYGSTVLMCQTIPFYLILPCFFLCLFWFCFCWRGVLFILFFVVVLLAFMKKILINFHFFTKTHVLGICAEVYIRIHSSHVSNDSFLLDITLLFSLFVLVLFLLEGCFIYFVFCCCFVGFYEKNINKFSFLHKNTCFGYLCRSVHTDPQFSCVKRFLFTWYYLVFFFVCFGFVFVGGVFYLFCFLLLFCWLLWKKY